LKSNQKKSSYTLLIVHAHPDDECSSTGGLIIKSIKDGHEVILVTCTNGEMGEIKDKNLEKDIKSASSPQQRLGEIRISELKKATKILGVQKLYTLGYKDSGMDGWDSNENSEAFMNADLSVVSKKIAFLIRKHRPHVVITYNERGGYGHPDHIMTHKVTSEAMRLSEDSSIVIEELNLWKVKKIYYTAWARSKMIKTWKWMKFFGVKTPLDDPDFREDKYGVPDHEITTYIDIRSFLRKKWKALVQHKSQITGNFFWWFVRLTGRWLYGEETFVCVKSKTPLKDKETSIFEGL
tara:strand:+ start:1972 stop:2853 length:882 start_codon:yes stop_codon:yes gene_type:complete